MKNTEFNFYPTWLDWEFLQNEFIISNPNISQELPGIPTELRIWRNEDYLIEAKISGINADPAFIHKSKKYNPGEIIQKFDLSGDIDQENTYYNIIGCTFGNLLEYSDYNKGDEPVRTFSINLSIDQISIVKQKKLIKWLTEWYLNGVKTGFTFNHVTTRELKESFSRTRTFSEKIEISIDNESFNSNVDFSFIQCSDFAFIIHLVPEEFNPQWSTNLGFEYREEFGKIPSKEEREAISEIVSFVLGKRLLNIGYTTFDEKGYPIDEVVFNPWGDNIRHLSQSAPIPPLDYFSQNNYGKIEKILPPLIEKYLYLRNKLQLNEVLWRYWIGRELPLGSNIPIIANGIEILSKYWFKSKNSKLKGIYLPKEDFDQLIAEDIVSITNKLEKIDKFPFKNAIINKINSSYQMSLTDKLKHFIEEIGIQIGPSEQEAIQCRHKMIHSMILMEDKDIEKIIRLSYSYQCFFHRIFLQLLEYNGDYIDYSIIGHPQKPINQVVGLLKDSK